jgi:hypothetical protein
MIFTTRTYVASAMALLSVLSLSACSTPVQVTSVAAQPSGAPAAPHAQPGESPGNPVDDLFARNRVAMADSGGMRIEVMRVTIGRKALLEQQGSTFPQLARFKDMQVGGEVIIKVTNTSDRTLAFHLDQSVFSINDEVIDYKIGDDIGDRFRPGAMAIVGYRFGIWQTPLRAIRTLRIEVPGPVNERNEATGTTIELQIDLSRREYQPREPTINQDGPALQ